MQRSEFWSELSRRYAFEIDGEAWYPALAFNGYLECFESDRGIQGLTHTPADDLAGMHGDQCSQEQTPFASPDSGQVGQPDLVWRRRR